MKHGTEQHEYCSVYGTEKKLVSMANSLSFIFLALFVPICVKAASLGDALITVYADPVPESNFELVRDKRDPEALGLRGLHHHHHHHHGSSEEYYEKPSSCYKCGEGNGGSYKPTATFAQSSAGTISGGGHGGHGGLGSNSVSQSAAYNFGPFSASFSASQSNANGGLYGGLF